MLLQPEAPSKPRHFPEVRAVLNGTRSSRAGRPAPLLSKPLAGEPRLAANVARSSTALAAPLVQGCVGTRPTARHEGSPARTVELAQRLERRHSRIFRDAGMTATQDDLLVFERNGPQLSRGGRFTLRAHAFADFAMLVHSKSLPARVLGGQVSTDGYRSGLRASVGGPPRSRSPRKLHGQRFGGGRHFPTRGDNRRPGGR